MIRVPLLLNFGDLDHCFLPEPDDYCKVAMINFDKWQELLDDAISHMRNNCDEGSTEFNNMEFIPMIKTEFNITESPSWQALQWFEKAKKDCKELCN